MTSHILLYSAFVEYLRAVAQTPSDTPESLRAASDDVPTANWIQALNDSDVNAHCFDECPLDEFTIR